MRRVTPPPPPLRQVPTYMPPSSLRSSVFLVQYVYMPRKGKSKFLQLVVRLRAFFVIGSFCFLSYAWPKPLLLVIFQSFWRNSISLLGFGGVYT